MPTPHQSIFIGWMLFLMPNQLAKAVKEKVSKKTKTTIDA